MLVSGRVSLFLKIEAVHTVVQLINCTLACANQGMSPDYFFYGTKPDSSIKAFGCFCYIGKDNTQCHELELRSKFGIYIRIDDESRSYRVYLLACRKIQIT